MSSYLLAYFPRIRRFWRKPYTFTSYLSQIVVWRIKFSHVQAKPLSAHKRRYSGRQTCFYFFKWGFDTIWSRDSSFLHSDEGSLLKRSLALGNGIRKAIPVRRTTRMSENGAPSSQTGFLLLLMFLNSKNHVESHGRISSIFQRGIKETVNSPAC